MAAPGALEVPEEARQLLGQRHAEAGFSGGWAWAFSRSTLCLWRLGASESQQHSHRLPYASTGAAHFVAALPAGPSGGRSGVVLVSEDGNSVLWTNFTDPEGPEPLASRIPGRVTALAAADGSDGVLAVAGMADGTVHLLVAVPGDDPAWQPLQQEQQEGSPPPAAAPSGMLGSVLGSVLRSRPAAQQAARGPPPSAEPVVGLHFAAGMQQLLVLRHDCLESWALAPGGQGCLVHSSPVLQDVQAAAGHGPAPLLALDVAHTGRATVLASAPGGLYVAVLAAKGAAGGSWTVAGCHRISEEAPTAGARLGLALAATGGWALVWKAGGQAVQLDLATGAGAHLESLTAPLLAAAAAPGAEDAWLLLDATGTLQRMPAGAALSAASAKRGQAQSAVRVETAAPPDPAALAAGATAGARSTDAVFQVLNAACQGELPPHAMAQQLASLGALRGASTANPIARFSRHVLDTLPKIFGAGGETVGEQLGGKLALHNVLLQCLSDGGCLAQLHPATLRAVFEDGQKLRALQDLRELESRLQEQRRGAGAEGLPFPLHEVAVAAGRRCMAHVLGGGDRTPWEVFYACPSVTVSAFLQEAADVAGSLAGAPGAGATQAEAVAQLAKAVQVCLGGAAAQRSQYQAWFPHPASAAAAGVEGAEWVEGGEARATLRALADACIRLQPLLAREAPARVTDCVTLTLDLSERLLNAHAAALAAAAPARRRAAKAEYEEARDALLGHLLRHAEARCRAGGVDGEALLQRVAGLAEAHSGYSLLFEACEFTGDRERLYELMTHLGGDDLTEPMAVYVFGRLLAEGRRSELLDLPPQFDADLAAWLADEAAPDAAQRLQIRWLHDLRVGDYANAAVSIAELAGASGERAPQLAAGEARRLLALDRLAAWAASPAWPSAVAGEVAGVAEAADAQLGLLALQARLGGGDAAPALLETRVVMEAALAPGREPVLVTVALEAYAAASAAFQQQHRGVFDSAWQRLAAATDWAALAAAQPGSTEAEFRAQVAATPLFAAAAELYGRENGALRGVVAPEEVYATLGQAASRLGSAAAREALLAAFQAGCASGLEAEVDEEERMALE